MQMNWQETTAIATFGLVLSSFGAILYASKLLRHERAYRQMANLERQLTFFLSGPKGRRVRLYGRRIGSWPTINTSLIC